MDNMNKELISMGVALGVTVLLTLASIYYVISRYNSIDYVNVGDVIIYCPKDNTSSCIEGRVRNIDKHYVDVNNQIIKKSHLRDNYVVRILYSQ